MEVTVDLILNTSDDLIVSRCCKVSPGKKKARERKTREVKDGEAKVCD